MAVDRKRKRAHSSDPEQELEANLSTTSGTPADQEATISASMLKQEEQLQKSNKSKAGNTKQVREIASMEESARVNRLKFLIEKSKIYTSILSEKLLKQQDISRSRGEAIDSAVPPLAKEGSGKARPGKKRKAATDTADVATALNEAKQDSAKSHGSKSNGNSAAPQQSARQPALITGGVMRDYQLDGLEWMVSLYENGLNGILADEMGLGKTLQTIAFLAFLRSKGVMGPFLIAAPLSTIANWVNEVRRFAPEIPVLLYHGSKDERARMRAKKMAKVGEKFPIIVTSYEIIMNDRKFLQKYQWKYIVVDEGHRLKNLNCKLIKELRSYSTANRLLLSGTPLQNNLSELWSLLNFLLPDIFSDLDSFQSWFDFSSLESDNAEGGQDMLANEEQSSVITNLHQILKPFLLRRLKVEVEKDLPPKREYLLYAPMTAEQTALYKAVLDHQVRAFYDEDGAEQTVANLDVDAPRGKRTRTRMPQRELSDDEYFDSLEQQADTPTTTASTPKGKSTKAMAGFDYSKLRNMLMSLRKVCNHPYQNHWPVYPGTDRYVVDDKLCTASGKMMLLKRLLTALLEKNHKVLIFSQFTTMLDIIEVWLEDMMDLKVCRIDGNVDQESRREQIAAFNEREDHKVFLLSTRAGGLGINLVSADTVILFDSDFNPQNDLQAMDRAHRIGQKRPVIVYRFASANTIETKILLRAQNKRRLEKAVIRRNSLLNQSSIMEMKDILLSEDAEKIQITSGDDEVLSEQDLEKLLDRSEAAYQHNYAGDKFKAMETKRDAENDALASH
ncbi:SNF2 family N-terminal domain-domain-containing protein [Protomyces lactucae-debilis]|uniref:SNF2 family N-terminal domain-domain-containing protein n=1 Tax=Protomyces lactucae-debilis TaxID=2754530 RepID=A0A1Y2FRY8_PROLT|nr:SNF2 family N-terminal domain-containing protein [Protomyces lactucae-debilis]ORY86770.1 SNF2 family N-terminal domain-domain-containing protein [Protomyces lactucae-debilis]